MYPFLRWLSVVLKRHRTRPSTVFEESVLRFHVWPGDLDFFFHMNNGRYLTLMDAGRWDIMSKLGLIRFLKERNWISVLGGASIRFLRPLKPFQGFDLRSRILGWDEKWFYLEQRFTEGDTVYATAVVKGLFRAPGRSIPTADILALVGETGPSPPIPIEAKNSLETGERP